MRKALVAIFACVIVGGHEMLVPAAAHAADPTYLAKRGITPARYEADEAECVAKAKKVYDESKAKINVPYQPGLAGAAVTGFFGGMERGKLKREAIGMGLKCIQAKGYTKVPFTKEQLAIYQQLDNEQRRKARGILAAGGNISRLLTN